MDAPSEMPDLCTSQHTMKELHVEWTSSRFLNLALQQNGFSLVPEVTLENKGAESLAGLACEVSVTPPFFAASRTFPVEELLPGKRTALRELKIDPDFDALLSLAAPLRDAREAFAIVSDFLASLPIRERDKNGRAPRFWHERGIHDGTYEIGESGRLVALRIILMIARKQWVD